MRTPLQERSNRQHTSLERSERRASEPAAHQQLALTTAETAECSCPDLCERDHERD